MTTAQGLVQRILSLSVKGRRVVALAGAPASGKSTYAHILAQALRDAGCICQVVPMDGFHLHNPILETRGQLDRKGAPQTIDAEGFLSLVSRIKHTQALYYPTFDRGQDLAISGSGYVDSDCDTVIVEGNYLLYDAPIWRDLAPHWDLSIYLDVPFDTLRTRLIERWLKHGLSAQAAETRAAQNDLINAKAIIERALPADVVVKND